MLLETPYEVKYQSTSEAAEAWSLKPRTVAKYCKQGLIPRAMKKKGRWWVPEGSIRPLSAKELKLTLLSMLKIHNHLAAGFPLDSLTVSEEKAGLEAVLSYLELHGYLSFQEENPVIAHVLFTDKAYETIASGINVDIGKPLRLIPLGMGIINIMLSH